MDLKMLNYWIVCPRAEALVPESLVEAVRLAGHRAELIAVRHWLFTALSIEVGVGSNLSRVLIDISEDFEQGTDLSTSDWEIVQELVEPQEVGGMGRLVHVRV